MLVILCLINNSMKCVGIAVIKFKKPTVQYVIQNEIHYTSASQYYVDGSSVASRDTIACPQ